MNGKSGIKAPSKKSDTSRKIPSRAGSEAALSRSSSVSTLASVLEGSDSHDGLKASDFAIGDRVWVNGTKPGHVQFLGETQFAQGVWAGVRLDSSDGKNDGSVAGVRYFECEPSQGIFIKPHRLTKQAESPDERSQSRTGIPPKLSLVSTPPRPPSSSKLKSGDRIVVNSANGVKTGILRFLGSTDFAAGEWAGIELDEPIGKNDGSVGGKRYFECPMKHGLFAPMHKVSRPGMRPTSSGRSLQNRSFSRESLNSTCSSIASSRTGARVKLGVTSLSNAQKAARSSNSAISASQVALEKVLKEKEEHIDQLLKELDLQRSEIVRTSKENEQVKKTLVKLEAEQNAVRQEHQTQVSHLENELKKTEAAAKRASNSWEDEKRKMEDLQFQLEEETILKGEMESQTDKANQRILELENLLKASEKNEEFVNQLAAMDANLATKNNQLSKVNDELRNLQDLLAARNSEIDHLKSSVNSSSEEVKRLSAGNEEANALKTKILSLEESHKVLRTDHDNVVVQMKSLKDAEESKTLKLTQNQKELNLLQEELQKKTDELSQLKNSLETERTHNSQTTTNVEKVYEEKVNEMTSEISKLKLELSEREKSYQELNCKFEAGNKFFAEKDTEVLQLKAHLENLENKCQIEASHGQDLQNKLSLLETAHAQTKAESNEVSVLREKIKTLSFELTDRETSNSNLQAQVTNLSNEMNNKNNVICELKQQVDEARKEMNFVSQGKSEAVVSLQKMLSEEKENHERARKEFQTSLSEFAANNENLSKLLSEKDSELSANSAALSSWQETLSQKDAELSQMNLDLKNSMEKMESMERTVKECSSSMEAEKEMFIREKEREIAQLRSEIKEYVSIMDTKSKESHDKQKEVSNLRQELQLKEAQLSDLNSMVDNSQNLLEALKQQNEKNTLAMETQVANFRVEQLKHFENKEKVLQTEIDRLTKELTEKDSILQTDRSQMAENQSKVADKEKIIEQLKRDLSVLESKLSESLSNETNISSELENKLKMLTSQCDKLKQENTEREKSAKKAHQELEETKSICMKDKMEHQALVKDKELKLEAVQREVDRMKKEFFQHKDGLQQKLDVTQMELEALKEFKAEMDMQQGVLEELQQQLQNSEDESNRLQKQLSEQSSVAKEKMHLDSKVLQLQQEIVTASENTKMAAEKHRQLQEELHKCCNLLNSKEKELEVLKAVKSPDESSLKVKALEKENLHLSSELANLKSTVAEKTSSNTQVAKDSDSDDDKEALLSQIDFLNSIIVDLQKRNNELNAGANNSNEEMDVNLNGKKQVPPRLYCDICGVFDVHDTEDCPTQSSFIEDVPHSHHQGKRGEERPYCNNCEVFGHWTLECNEQETF